MKTDFQQEQQEYLTFLLGDNEYGVDILRVQEIRVWSPVTDIPNTPDFMKGVINLRGTIVPIIDLRQRFSCSEQVYNSTTVVIVLQDHVRGKAVSIGLVVDAVSDVHKLHRAELKDAPDLGEHIDDRFIQGMVTEQDRIIVLLDSTALLDVNELFRLAG